MIYTWRSSQIQRRLEKRIALNQNDFCLSKTNRLRTLRANEKEVGLRYVEPVADRQPPSTSEDFGMGRITDETIRRMTKNVKWVGTQQAALIV